MHRGEAELVCNLSSRENGVQKLVLSSGGGLEFDAVVAPMVDGVVELEGPTLGGMYQFTSHLAKPAKGRLEGIGEVEIDKLETRVAVRLKSYQQPGGPGGKLSFTSEEIIQKGIYVEFLGEAVAPAPMGGRYVFRVNLGRSRRGSGEVQPADANRRTDMYEKAVTVQSDYTMVLAPMVVQARTAVRKKP